MPLTPTFIKNPWLSSRITILNGKIPLMETTITVDKAGRMVLPKKVRDELRLEPGDSLDLISGGGQVILRPSRSATRLRKSQGVWILSAGTPILAAETDRVLEDIRQGRRGE